MYNQSHNFLFKLLVCFCALVGFTSSAIASDGADSSTSSAPPALSDSKSVVFGKFRLLMNGYETELGQGLFGNTAALRLYRADDQAEFTGRVGKDGEFSLELAPGDYYVMSISFKHRGETIEPETNFMFNVSADHEASYIGTIMLEATFSSGYNGMKGTFERFTIHNDCVTDCDRRLAELGLSRAAMETALPAWQAQFARN